MEVNSALIKNLITSRKVRELEESLISGWDPNVGGGWPIRLAARYGCSSIVETLIRHGANPHLLSESGASTLQLAVYSREHWGDINSWSFLLSCCDSSQLADGAAVAIIFSNFAALERLLETGRCNTHIPTSLTGKTLEELAKGYKMTHLLNTSIVLTQSPDGRILTHSPRTARVHRSDVRSSTLTPQLSSRNLSPSVARFFQQTAGQPSLTSPRRSAQVLEHSSPTHYLNRDYT